MSKLNRRQLIQAAALTPWAWQLGESGLQSSEFAAGLRIATFRFDVTPPIGHSCCGGWIKPVEVVDDTLASSFWGLKNRLWFAALTGPGY